MVFIWYNLFNQSFWCSIYNEILEKINFLWSHVHTNSRRFANMMKENNSFDCADKIVPLQPINCCLFAYFMCMYSRILLTELFGFVLYLILNSFLALKMEPNTWKGFFTLMCCMLCILCSLAIVSPNSWDHSDGLASARKLHVVTCNFPRDLWLNLSFTCLHLIG